MKIRAERELDQEANRVLQALDMWRVPVDPFAIVREEGIELAPGEYGPNFDARIEYLTPIRQFAIYYKEAGVDRTGGRVRFSIGHELAHYYLHRDDLLTGRPHNSVADFRSKNALEQEADEFSARLLMPKELFVESVHRFRQDVCILSELCQLAENVFRTSLTSTVRRYCQCDIEPASMVISENGKVKWAIASEDMKRLGMGFIQVRQNIPTNSKTALLWQRLSNKEDISIIDGGVDATIWFDRPYRWRLWEEAMPLGKTGWVLTYLTLDDQDD